jgi:hypothetical protein
MIGTPSLVRDEQDVEVEVWAARVFRDRADMIEEGK